MKKNQTSKQNKQSKKQAHASKKQVLSKKDKEECLRKTDKEEDHERPLLSSIDHTVLTKVENNEVTDDKRPQKLTKELFFSSEGKDKSIPASLILSLVHTHRLSTAVTIPSR